MSPEPQEPDVAERLAALEARVRALETGERSASDPVDGGTGGHISYAGETHLHGDVSWSIGCSPDAVLDLPATGSMEVLAALGHPVRHAIVRTLLRGPATAPELQAAVGLSSTGQLYHHLKSLTSTRIVEQPTRGDYRLAPTTVVPALVLILAAADVAGDLRR